MNSDFSFDTSRITASWNSPVIGDRWTVSARLSRIASDGYRDQSWSRMGMAFITAERRGDRSLLRFNLYGGQEELHLAYVGLTRAQRELALSLAVRRKRYGDWESREPSRFLAELPEEDLVRQGVGEPVNAEEQQARGKAHLANLRDMLSA